MSLQAKAFEDSLDHVLEQLLDDHLVGLLTFSQLRFRLVDHIVRVIDAAVGVTELSFAQTLQCR